MEIKAGGGWRAFSSFQRTDESTYCIRHTYIPYGYTNSEALWFTWNIDDQLEVPLFITFLTLGMAPTCLPDILTALVVKVNVCSIYTSQLYS